MKKLILRVAAAAAIAALVCVGCNDSGTTKSSVNNGRVDDFLSGLKGKRGKDTAAAPDGNTSVYYTLTVNTHPENSGVVSLSPDNETYKAGDTVTVTVNANPGYTFVNWSGMSNAETESVTLFMHGDFSLTANFNESDAVETDTVLPDIALNVSLQPSEVIKDIPFTDPGASASDGRGNILNYYIQIKNSAGETVETINTSTVGIFYITYIVCKTLTYPSGNKTDTCARAVREVRVVEPPEILPTYTLTTGANPAGGGTIARNPDKTAYTAGENVTVTAEADPGYTFTGWTGASLPADASAKIIMSGNLTLTANFLQQTYKLDVSEAAGGSVSRNPSKDAYTYGEEVTVSASEAAGHQFSGWSGSITSTNPTITVKMDKNITLTPAFRQLTYTLAVSANPETGGSVSRDPSKNAYTYGEEVTISASAAAGQQFSGWSGSLTSTSPTITVNMDSSMTLTAKFQPQTATTTYTLTTVASPAGGGEITRSPDKTAYSANEHVTVTAAENPGYTFTGWQGASKATTTSVTVTMNNNLNLTAVFQQQKYFLSVSAAPVDAGTVTRDEPNKTEYVYGETVIVTATATKTGYRFDKWSGASTDATSNVAVIMTENKTLTANFVLLKYTLTVSASDGGETTRNPDSATYSHGTTVQINATADAGYTFTGWSDGSTENPRTVSMDGDKTLTANFQQQSVTTFIDSRDGKTYKKVTIGTQTWMAENLNRATTYSKCYGGSADNCSKYGRLYNWSDAQTACPADWHLPDTTEWNTLVSYVETEKSCPNCAGKYLKSQDGWTNCGPEGSGPSYVCEDAFGFSALPGGNDEVSVHSYYYAGNYGGWWSSTEYNATYAWFRMMYYSGEIVQNTNQIKGRQISVRCVAD